MTNIATDLDHRHLCWAKCISWSAVLSGALVAIGLGFLLNLFGLAIGLSAFTTDKEGMAALAIGGYIGLLIGAVITMYIAGWVAAYLGRHYYRNLNYFNRRIGAVYGFVTWAAALIIMVIIAAQINDYIATYQSTLARPNSVLADRSDQTARSATMAGGKAAQDRAASAMPGDNVQEKQARLAGMTLFSMFLLFFVGAISATFGGIYGFIPRDEEDEIIESPKRRKST